MSIINSFTQNQTGVIGERTNWVQCFNARDTHFDCLDQYNDIRENHHKCARSYQAWQQYCDAGIRRIQYDERARDRQDARLYTSDQLKAYNKERNEKTWDKPNHFNLVQ
ncbi:hypothetical protein PPERSA_09346 [Pseudocohnilembus persalinus]|uniref:Uncharacterized protein n=1 Tax=Pseudocohnilembus persalinus TaxID=266149 RepID=A0A0V0QXR1_PSEPJ|nr:hypothetical protein PPERSA_09346 [Pseudocohnilembus persalinus]|eukprot:KRX07132.1 hypothetical protein PPERSA_09346 [Pseudocohnilembus persalinus]